MYDVLIITAVVCKLVQVSVVQKCQT